ncbi:MAG: transposase [Gammaproteobacteria bacterium]
MPRTARASVGGICYHAISRGNRRATVFHDPADFRAFIGLMDRATRKVPMRVSGYCLMPNHFHFVLWPYRDGDLSKWMQWLLTAHVRRYHRIYGTDGRVWQGRFKAFPIEQDQHFLSVLRYVERNALRANLVARAEDWPWSSLKSRPNDSRIGNLPVSLPGDWLTIVNRTESEAELKALRRAVNRGSPFGNKAWQREVAEKLGLEQSLRRRGRPRKTSR